MSSPELSLRINDLITASTVRLIDSQGTPIGDLPLAQALNMAEQEGLDLIEVSPNAEPPVCKMLDAGKYKYDAAKRKNAQKKKQAVVVVKELQLRPATDEHDYQTKLRQARRFIEDRHEVRVNLKFFGREITHQDIGFAMLNRFIEDVRDIAKVKSEPKLEGRQVFLGLAPR